MRIISNKRLRAKQAALQKWELERSGTDTTNVVGAVYDVALGFLTIEEAMIKYFDEPMWPATGVPPYAQDIVRQLLKEVREWTSK